MSKKITFCSIICFLVNSLLYAQEKPNKNDCNFINSLLEKSGESLRYINPVGEFDYSFLEHYLYIHDTEDDYEEFNIPEDYAIVYGKKLKELYLNGKNMKILDSIFSKDDIDFMLSHKKIVNWKEGKLNNKITINDTINYINGLYISPIIYNKKNTYGIASYNNRLERSIFIFKVNENGEADIIDKLIIMKASLNVRKE